MTGKRIQLSRMAGRKKPPETVNVARPGRFGNPFVIGCTVSRDWLWIGRRWKPVGDAEIYIADRTQAVDEFRRIAGNPPFVADVLVTIAGNDVACWCAVDDQPCHGDVILRIAAGGTP